MYTVHYIIQCECKCVWMRMNAGWYDINHPFESAGAGFQCIFYSIAFLFIIQYPLGHITVTKRWLEKNGGKNPWMLPIFNKSRKYLFKLRWYRNLSLSPDNCRLLCTRSYASNGDPQNRSPWSGTNRKKMHTYRYISTWYAPGIPYFPCNCAEARKNHPSFDSKLIQSMTTVLFIWCKSEWRRRRRKKWIVDTKIRRKKNHSTIEHWLASLPQYYVMGRM